jgi:hypothetical protein
MPLSANIGPIRFSRPSYAVGQETTCSWNGAPRYRQYLRIFGDAARAAAFYATEAYTAILIDVRRRASTTPVQSEVKAKSGEEIFNAEGQGKRHLDQL